MINRNFYIGFEGEPELIVERVVGDELRSSVRAWIGDFAQLMEHVPPSVTGWTGIALHHHLVTGWNETTNWTDPDPADTLAKLTKVMDHCGNGRVRLLAEALRLLIEESNAEGGEIVWRVE